MTNHDNMLTATVLPISEDHIDTAFTALKSLDFDVRKVTGGALIITASRQTFFEVFDYAVAIDDAHQALFLVEGNAMPELSSLQLPPSLSASCTAVEFHRPPDFGPGNF